MSEGFVMIPPSGTDGFERGPMLRLDEMTNPDGFKTSVFLQRVNLGENVDRLLLVVEDERDSKGESARMGVLAPGLGERLRDFLNEQFPFDEVAK